MTSTLEELFAFQATAAGLPAFEREVCVIPGRKFRFDFAFIEQKLLVEIQGGTYNGGAHGRGVGINRDYEKGNLAVMHGWRVLQFDTKQVKSGEALNVTEKILRGEK